MLACRVEYESSAYHCLDIRMRRVVRHVPGTNGTVRLGSERKFSSGTWKIFVILPRALAIDDDFKNLPWLKSRTFLASAN